MDKYLNRQHAGEVLAQEIEGCLDISFIKKAIVLSLPRGGVPVGYEIAKKFGLPLDVIIVRKLGVPTNPEFAFGALASNGETILNQEIIEKLAISDKAVKEVVTKEKKELKRRELAYRGNRNFPKIRDKIIFLVDDGIATGYTIKAAIMALKPQNPAKIIVAVPVAAQDTFKELQGLVDKVICPLTPQDFYAVGLWYKDFAQTSDEEVKNLICIS